MGYVEDLRDLELENFAKKIAERKAEGIEDSLFEVDFSIVSFSCRFREGFDLLKRVNALIGTMQKWKKGVDKSISKMYKEIKKKVRSDKNVERSKQKEFLKYAKKLCKDATKDEADKIRKVKKIRNNLRFRLYNIFIYITAVILSLGYATLLYQKNSITNVIIYPLYGLTIFGFIAIQVLYTIKYLKAIRSTIRGIIVYSVKRAYSALLVAWWYLSLLVVINTWDVKISTYSFAVIFILYIIFAIYNLFLSSSFFDEIESTLSLVAAIIIGLVSFTDVLEGQPYMSQLAGIMMLCACFLLTIIIVKKFLIDKPSIKDITELIYAITIALTSIVLTFTAFYKLFWVEPVEGQVVENTLFSAVVGVYAAVLGGGITLLGVAWTIKHTEKQRQEEEKKKAKPIFTFLMSFELLQDVRGKRVCFDDEETTKFPCNVTALLENSERAVFSIERVFHDEQWWEMNGNKVVLPNACVYLDFNFSEDVNNLFMEVKDSLDNLYYYEVKVLCLNLLTKHKGNDGNRLAHTIRELKEITIEEINERIKKSEA